MRRRLLFEQGDGIIEDPSLAPPLSIVLANKEEDEKLIIVEENKYNRTRFPKDVFEPIGIVVIPGEHGVLKDENGKNQCGVMALEHATTNDTMQWGDDGEIPGLKPYTNFTDTGDVDGKIAIKLGYGSYAILPWQGLGTNGIPIRHENEGKDLYMPTWGPSPYIGDDYISGGYNESYGTTMFDTDTKNNAFADFDGLGNTKKIIEKRGYKDYSKWWPSRDKKNSLPDYPAASYCDMYSTVGTKQGDWYLPSIGELGYIPPRITDITNVITKAKGYPYILYYYSYLLSSTISSDSGCFCIYRRKHRYYYNYMSAQSVSRQPMDYFQAEGAQDHNARVIPFMRL